MYWCFKERHITFPWTRRLLVAVGSCDGAGHGSEQIFQPYTRFFLTSEDGVIFFSSQPQYLKCLDTSSFRQYDIKRKGIDRPAVDYYLRSGKLEAVARGVYRKPGPPLKWQNVVYSLQLLGYQVHVGHFSALQYHGFQHYLTFGSIDQISLYYDNRLPSWIDEFDQFSFTQMDKSPFANGSTLGTVDVAFGTWDWPIKYSTPERAFIELMSTIKTAEEISHAQMMLEGAANLRPRLLQDLLEQCWQIKAKRLFLWMARTSGHAWYMQIDKTHVDLGSGKRQIVAEGVLDKEFLITVPKGVSDGHTESIF